MRALLIISMIFAVTSLTARASVTYTITSYPGGLADLPCDAFEKNADGSWTQVAILVAGGALIPAGNRFKDSAETRIIEKKCNKQQVSVQDGSIRPTSAHLPMQNEASGACPSDATNPRGKRRAKSNKIPIRAF